MTDLYVTLAEGEVRLEPLREAHREGLRAACAADREIWTIYPVNLTGDDFDPGFDKLLAKQARLPFAILSGERVIGTSAYLAILPDDRVLEIGGTYIDPADRGTGINAVMKRLMIGHAIACGYTRIEFRVDTRNTRSMAAVAKLGATREGVLRRNRITWTGYVRDTAIYSLLADEWAARRG